MQLGARRTDGRLCPSSSARLVSKLRTPVAHYSWTVVVRNRRLTRGSATSSEAESSKQEEQAKENDRIQQTLADLDALLGIEEEPEEVIETKTEVGAGNVFGYLFALLQLEDSFWPSPPLIFLLTVLLIFSSHLFFPGSRAKYDRRNLSRSTQSNC